MGVIADRERLIRNLVRVRRAQAQQPASAELPAVRADLEDLVGDSVSKALAARVLGVSRSALDKRIARGDVSVVLTRDGRHEVPVGALVALAGAVAQVDPSADARSALGAVLDSHRRDAERVSDEELLPASYLADRDRHTHRRAELRSLAYHRAVARRLTPQVLADARHRLARWRSQGVVHGHYAQQWERLLDQPLAEIARVIIADDQRGRDLRQNSPFAGVLSEPERRRAAAAAAR